MVCTQNWSKCEVFWLSGDQSFVDFPPAVKRVVLPEVGGIDVLGSPIWDSSDFFYLYGIICGSCICFASTP